MGQDKLNDLTVRFLNLKFDLITPTIKNTLGNHREKRDNQANRSGNHRFGNTIRDRSTTPTGRLSG